jgi:flagellar assembly protein FliH
MDKSADASASATILKSSRLAQHDVQAWQFVDLDLQRKELLVKQEQAEKLAEEQPAKLIKEAAFEQAKRDGFEQGYQEGFEQGQAAGLQAAAAENHQKLSDIEQRIEPLLRFLSEPHQQLEDAVFEQTVELAIALAEGFLEDAVPKSTDQLAGLVKQAMLQLQPEPEPDEPVMTLWLHEQDAAALDSVLKSFRKDLKIYIDNQLTPGNFRLHHKFSEIKSDWRAQLKTYLQTVREDWLSLTSE